MSTAYTIFSSIIMKIAFRTNATVMCIRTMWGDVKITVPPSDDFALSGEDRFFFMLVFVFANALADPSFRDVYLSECDIWLNQDWSDTRKMSGEQPELGKCHRAEAAWSAAAPALHAHMYQWTHTWPCVTYTHKTVHMYVRRWVGRRMAEVFLLPSLTFT